MRKLILFLVMFGSVAFANAQSGNLNQRDVAGKKNGKWIIYLNKYWKPLKDSSNAAYSRYDYFDHGYDIYPMGQYGNKNWKLENFISNPPSISKIHLLDGDYKWLDANGVVRSTHKFNKGEPVYGAFFKASGKPDTYYCYTKKWIGQPYTYSVGWYDKNGKETATYLIKSKGKWGLGMFGDSTTYDSIRANGDSLFINLKIYYHGKLRRECGEILVGNRNTPIVDLNMINNGHCIEWYHNSTQKSFEGDWAYGKQIGVAKHWDENGKEIVPDSKQKK